PLMGPLKYVGYRVAKDCWPAGGEELYSGPPARASPATGSARTDSRNRAKRRGNDVRTEDVMGGSRWVRSGPPLEARFRGSNRVLCRMFGPVNKDTPPRKRRI